MHTGFSSPCMFDEVHPVKTLFGRIPVKQTFFLHGSFGLVHMPLVQITLVQLAKSRGPKGLQLEVTEL